MVSTEQVCGDDGGVHATASVYRTLQLQELSVLPQKRAEVVRLQQMTNRILQLRNVARDGCVFFALGF